MTSSRRAFVRSLAASATATSALGLAGCMGDGTPGLHISNSSGSRVTVTVQLSRPKTGHTVVLETVTLEPDGSQRYTPSLTRDYQYELTVGVENGPTESYGFQGSQISSSRGIYAFIRENTIEFRLVAE